MRSNPNQYWRQTKIAIRSRLFEEFWNKPKEIQAWLIAAYETEDTLETVMTYAVSKQKEGGSE